MEQRIALAVDAFVQGAYSRSTTDSGFFDLNPPVQADGWVVITGHASDDIYIQQVATAPQSLLYADNSSFFDTPGVSGDFGQISDIESYRSVLVTNAERRSDAGVVNDNYPVFDFTSVDDQVKTRFLSQHDLWTLAPITGILQYTQADGTVSRWDISGNRNALTFGAIGGLTGTSYGVLGGPAARPGDLFPVAASHIEPIPVRAQSSLEITWQIEGASGLLRAPGAPLVSPFSSVPFLESLTYTYDDETVFLDTQITEVGILPSAPSLVVSGVVQPALFTLPNAVGTGSSAIVPGTLSGTLSFNGTTYPFFVESVTGTRLVFGGGLTPAGDPAGFEYVLRTVGGKPKTVSGSVDLATGVIALRFQSYARNGLTDAFYEQAPGPVTIDATYAVYSAGDPNDPAGSLTVFAGHDITREVAVDLLPHGATVHIDSPLVMAANLTGGDISLRATNVNIDARLLANDRLDVAGSVAPRNRVVSQAYAAAEIDGSGSVTNIFIPPGMAGAGYDPLNPPLVTISVPGGGGTAATATAVVDASGRIFGFNLISGGSGYAARPTVTIAPPEVASAAAPGAVSVAGGVVTGVAVASGGYGYRTAPQVWIAPPPEASGGTQATAFATVDSAGRVTGITILDGGAGYETMAIDGTVSPFVPEVRILAPVPLPQAEVVKFNAAVGASVFEVHVGDDLGTERDRGLVLVSPTGWLTKDLAQVVAADAVFVQAVQSDVIVEGTIWATNQSYLMQSLETASDLAPFLLTNTSLETGASVGMLRGGTVGITLANDAPTPAEGAVAFNDVRLSTDVDSLRIRAATSAGVTRSDPFPYELQVVEENNIAIEAVAASSFPLSMEARQNLVFNANLATVGDVNLKAGALMTMSAPLSSTKGRIGISAANLTIENSVRVTQADDDETRDDIVLEASAGSMTINGLVSAVNNVLLRQANRLGPEVFEYSNRTSVAILDNTTVSQSITVVDAFEYENIDVAVDITHTFVADLRIVLVAPDGTRIRLFDRSGGGGDNLTGTIFDSEATTAITAGTAPFTGRFRPVESLVPLYNRDARGTWRLEVTDNARSDEGSLTNFTLQFTSQQPVTGRISGAARVKADHLTIDAEGNVGDPELAPGAGTFYLRTDVDSLSGRAGAGFSIDEVSDIHITGLVAGGLVSVRAAGVDPVAGPNLGRAALTASLADVPAIDLNAPSGSIDVINNAPKTIIIGNAEALRRGQAISMRAAGDVTIRSTGGATRGEIYALDAPLAGSGARTARYRYAPSALPAGTVYAPGVPGTTASTITGSGTLAAVLGVAPANLRVNDRVLVSVAGGSNANGVYTVVRLGGSTTWLLTRAADSDTAVELPANSFVRVADGAGAGVYQLTYASSPATPFARCPIGVSGPLSLVTNIGSDDVNDAVTFVVSTAGATNTAAGSLGKMINLRQANDTSSSASNPNQKMDFRFSSQVLTPIRLTQQLPQITKPFRIDGNTSYNPPGSPGVTRPRISVDGSRIATTREGNAITTTSVVNGFEVAGAGAAGAVLANMTVAGFTKGAAVRVQNASTVLASGLTLGASELGLRVANQYGLWVSETSSEVTLLNSTVTAATKAGVRVEGAARDVVLVGNTIGTVDRDNSVGVQIEVSAGNRNRIGVEPVLPLTAVPPLSATRVNATTFTLPSSVRLSSAALFPGLGVTGPGIVPAAGGPAAVIQSVTIDPVSGVATVVVTGGQVNAGGRVTFGNFAATTLGSTTLAMPAGVNADQLYLGQQIAGTGIFAGSRIVAVNRATKVVTLSAAMNATGVSSLTFPGANNGAPRNVIQNNLTGVELSGGATTIINTSIINSSGDGVRITGGTNVVGRVDRTRSAFANMIHGNGGFGIVVDARSSGRAQAVTLANQQVVRGNYLGMLTTNRPAPANTKGNIGLRFNSSTEELYPGAGPAFKYRPSTATGLDAEGNQHAPSTTGTGGSGGGTGIPPVPPPR